MNDVQKVINQKFIKIGIYKEFLNQVAPKHGNQFSINPINSV